LEEKVDKAAPIEKRVATLSQRLGLNELIAAAQQAVNVSKYSLRIVADRLDEGYEADPTGVAILTGLVYAFDALSHSIPSTSTTAFLRDNIFRSVQAYDPDYSRNIEGDVLRLHWDEYHLFNMICNRLRVAFKITQEKSLRVWETVTAHDLVGIDGFRRCLRLTLYRPRDLLVLINHAFNHALSHSRDRLVGEDIDASAHEISCSRLDDLKKEYREIIPGIDRLVSVFAGGKSEVSRDDVADLMRSLPASEDLKPAEAQTIAIIRTPEELVHSLFSVGFLGVWKPAASSFVFCHDGKDPDFTVDSSSRLLIHPCYWIALNLQQTAQLNVNDMEEIHDDYRIKVTSETPEIRERQLGQFMTTLGTISEGEADAARFEMWCLEAIRIVFATGIVNCELHPNRDLTQRRDIIGRNTGNTETWRRILEDYRVRQVIFEVKNYSEDLGPDEYRQMLSYLCGEHGSIGFIINRSTEANLERDRELRWVREIYHEHDHRVVVKLPAKLIVGWISKLRNPQKHDAPDKGLGALLDTYERLYLRLGGTTRPKKK
jgi:hypothetical protein